MIFSNMKEFEATSKSLMEMTFWLDWWMIRVQGMANFPQPDNITKVYWLVDRWRKGSGAPF